MSSTRAISPGDCATREVSKRHRDLVLAGVIGSLRRVLRVLLPSTCEMRAVKLLAHLGCIGASTIA